MPSAQDAFATKTCEWPGCPSDAEHRDGLCERHHRLQTHGSPAPAPARCDECRRPLTGAHSEACSQFVDQRHGNENGNTSTPRIREEPEMPADPPVVVVLCKRPDCSEPALASTVDLKSNRYKQLCAPHYDAEREKARRVPVGLSGQPAPLGWDDARGGHITGSEGLVVPPSEICLAGCIVIDHDRSDGSPCVLRGGDHELALEEPEEQPDAPAPEPEHEAWCMRMHAKAEECLDFAGRTADDRLEQHITELVVPGSHPRQHRPARPHDYFCASDPDHEGLCEDSDGRDWVRRDEALRAGGTVAPHPPQTTARLQPHEWRDGYVPGVELSSELITSGTPAGRIAEAWASAIADAYSALAGELLEPKEANYEPEKLLATIRSLLDHAEPIAAMLATPLDAVPSRE